jgi:hypothetical protein
MVSRRGLLSGPGGGTQPGRSGGSSLEGAAAVGVCVAHSSLKCTLANQAPSRGSLTWPKISGACSPGEQHPFLVPLVLEKKRLGLPVLFVK